MAFQQTITIVNNSGKIISTGKHLVDIYREARAAYRDKKDALRDAKEGRDGRSSRPKRGMSVNGSQRGRGRGYHEPIYEEPEDFDRRSESEFGRHRSNRRLGHGREPLFLEGSKGKRPERSERSERSQRPPPPRRSSSGNSAPLTEGNLRTHSEIAASPSFSRAYQQQQQQQPTSQNIPRNAPPPFARSQTTMAGIPTTSGSTPISTPRMSMMANRPRSDPSLRHRAGSSSHGHVDMDLAYGSVPPDLVTRSDLSGLSSGDSTDFDEYDEYDGPGIDGSGANGNNSNEAQKEAKATTLVHRIESLLTEAQCLHHSATAIIFHLQENPEAAAAVALTLAELSALLGKLSPAFLGAVKGGSPAVFALLASPQFLIGTSIAVGMTVVVFGGWKIVKRMTKPMALQEGDDGAASSSRSHHPRRHPSQSLPHARAPPTLAPGNVDEALVLQQEMSSIETWRRGIVGDGGADEATTVELELISPEAMRSRLSCDVPSRKASQKTSRHGDSRRSVPDRTSSKGFSESRESHRRSRSRHDKADKAMSDTSSVSESNHSHRSHHSNHSHRSSHRGSHRGTHRRHPPETDTRLVPVRSKEKTGGNMLKQLFKKKKGKGDETVSVA